MVIFVALSALFQSLSLDVWRLIGPYGAALTAVAFVAIVATCCGKAEGVGP